MNCLPDPQQEALLEVLFRTEAGAARDLARRWLASTDLERLDPASSRLLYTLHLRLRELGLEAESPDKVRGAYKLHWSRMALLHHEGACAIRLLAEAGIPSVLLKSTALQSLYPDETLMRSTSDVDFYVSPAHAERAASLLVAAGWRMTVPPAWTEEMRFKHGLSLRKPGMILLDLHWCPIYRHLMPPVLPRDYPLRSVPSSLEGLSVAATEPTDLLFHILAHGASPMRPTSFHWIIDAMILLRRNPGRIDYARIRELAGRYRAQARVQRTLGHLKTRWGVAVPDDLTSTIVPQGLIDEPDPVDQATGWAYLGRVISDGWKTAGKFSGRQAGLRWRLADLRLYFRWVWGLKPGQSLLLAASSKALRRILRRR